MVCLSKSDKLRPTVHIEQQLRLSCPFGCRITPPTVHIEQQIRLIC